MADVQSYQRHTRWLPPFHFFVLPVMMINVLYEMWALKSDFNTDQAWSLVVSLALAGVALFARTQALSAQDRVIRLEMKLRLATLLPADLQARFNEITVSQLVGLRFASDAELPDLVRKALSDNMSQGDIKKAIKTWVPDTQRV